MFPKEDDFIIGGPGSQYVYEYDSEESKNVHTCKETTPTSKEIYDALKKAGVKENEAAFSDELKKQKERIETDTLRNLAFSSGNLVMDFNLSDLTERERISQTQFGEWQLCPTTFIYALSEDGKIRYIGKANNPTRRLQAHIKRSEENNSHKNNWIRKLLKNNKEPELIILDEVPKSNWEFWEQHYISLYKSWGFDLTNSTFGGEGGNTPESLKKMVQTRIKNGTYILSEDTKKKMSDNRSGDKNHFYNRKHSEETKRKIGEKSLNRKDKIIIEIDGDIIKIWDSLREAAEFYDIRADGISKACSKRLKTYKDKKWFYQSSWELCPKCQGEGFINNPKFILMAPEGYNQSPTIDCYVCEGKKILAKPVINV